MECNLGTEHHSTDTWNRSKTEQAVVDAFDESLFGAVASDIGSETSLYSHAVKTAPSPPWVASPKILYQQLIRDLDFSEGPRLLSCLETWNEDLFSCFPINEDLYSDMMVLSPDPDDVISTVSTKDHVEMFNLTTRGSVRLPSPPKQPTGLPAYVQEVQDSFTVELRAREEAYTKLLVTYCKSIIRYLQGTAKRTTIGLNIQNPDQKAYTQLRQSILLRYYREVASLARLLYLHLYLTVTREFSWRLYASQSAHPDVFAALKFTWTERRQFTCAFHPVLCNHGIVLLEGKPLTASALREINYRRRELGLPLVRCGLVEENKSPLVQQPSFSVHLPRSVGFLTHHIKRKLDAYAVKHPQEPRHVRADHPYAKVVENRNYGSSIEAMILAPPSPSEILPGDPPRPPTCGFLTR